MASLFDKNKPKDEERTRTPYELIGKEIDHLKKKQSTRHGKHTPANAATWLGVLVLCGLICLYIMDPCIYAWYKG